MTFLHPLGLLGLIGVPIIILIYVLKNKYVEQIIPTTYIWTLSERFLRRRNPFSKIAGIISLILQLLPGTQGLYGLLVAVLLLSNIGVLGGGAIELTLGQGIMYFVACLPIAFGGLISGIFQGRTAAAGIGIIAKKPDESGKAIIMAAMVETYAILALLISILIIYNI